MSAMPSAMQWWMRATSAEPPPYCSISSKAPQRVLGVQRLHGQRAHTRLQGVLLALPRVWRGEHVAHHVAVECRKSVSSIQCAPAASSRATCTKRR